MPTCPQCDNRSFANKEALLQHMKSSSSWHPFCEICDRRFSSKVAYDAHMGAKHPPTFDCIDCERSFHAQFALEDHYRGSSAHPNCPICGRGFKDAQANEEHHRTAHIRVTCTPCGGIVLYEEALAQHYLESPNHPKCKVCLRGCKDDLAYREHLDVAHPELACGPCNERFEAADAVENHYWTSPAHPKCGKCGLGLQDDEKLLMHMQEAHPLGESAPLELKETLYSTGFTPLSPRHKLKAAIAGERSPVDSPALRLHINFASPIKEVAPVFSPVGLPRPGKMIDELWASRDNVQVRSPPTIPPSTGRPGITRPRSESDALLEEAFSPILEQSYDDRFSDFTQPISPKRPPLHLNTSSLASVPTLGRRPPLQIKPLRGRDVPAITSPVEFHPRLYPGSARAAAAATRSSSAASSLHSHGQYVPPSFSGFHSKSRSLLGSPGRQIHESESEHIDWVNLLGERAPPMLSSTSEFSVQLTPKVDTPPTARALLVDDSRPLASPLDVRSLSSAASSFTGLYSPLAFEQADSRPTTVLSVQELSNLGPVYNFTASSDCSSPRSPDITSPIDLAILPQAPPVPSTPSDFAPFDLPEARKPLPDSPSTPLSSIASVAHTNPSSPCVLLSATSLDLPATSPIGSVISPAPIELAADGLNDLASSEEQSLYLKDDTLVAGCAELPEDAALSTRVIDVAVSVSPLPEPIIRLHCRECRANPCENITATMCGHIFCYKCITEAVIKTSRCPVCSTPTLLYCLFKLDLNN